MTGTDSTRAHLYSFARPHRPGPVRLANLAGRHLERTSRKVMPLSVDSVVRAAERRTGLSDPESVQKVREPLEQLLASLEAESQLNAVGRWAARNEAVGLLAKRLRVQEHLRRHPEVLDVPVEQPVFIIGFPRTGSTLLQRLMALDSGNRVPRFWELLDPVPPRVSPGRGGDPRVKKAKQYLRWVEYASPLALQIHPMAAEDPDECRLLLETSLVGPQHMRSDVPSYVEWFWEQPTDVLEAACRELRTQIQVLKHGDGELRWVGKNPGHSAFGRGLVRAFPDARVVVLHRDPAESIPSLCSLVAVYRSIFTDHIDLPALGQEVMRGFVRSMDRMMEMRGEPSAASFHDVHYRQLVTDPIGTVRGIYAHAGLPFSSRVESGIERYLAQDGQQPAGPHRYSADQFGLSPEGIRESAERYLRWLGKLVP